MLLLLLLLGLHQAGKPAEQKVTLQLCLGAEGDKGVRKGSLQARPRLGIQRDKPPGEIVAGNQLPFPLLAARGPRRAAATDKQTGRKEL